MTGTMKYPLIQVKPHILPTWGMPLTLITQAIKQYLYQKMILTVHKDHL